MVVLLIIHALSLLFASNVDSKGAPIEKYRSGQNRDYEAAVKFLEENDVLASTMYNKESVASWNHDSNITEESKKALLEAQTEIGKFLNETQKNATSYAWKEFRSRNETIYRWFRANVQIGTSVLPEDKLEKFNNLVANMTEMFSKVKICPKDNSEDKPCALSLEPELTEIFSESRDYDELKHFWTEWRKATGKIKPLFLEYVKLYNEAAALNGFEDAGDMWRDDYESETFVEDVEELWKVIEPFYQQLHAFVRRRLINQYPDKGISPDGPIPAHILGNMWALSWPDIFDVVKPYPEKEFVDVSERMKKQNMTALDMFKLSEEFYTSLGLKAMTPEFWNRSIIEKLTDREMICHASAWDFYDGKDFRIKMCTEIEMGYLITVHHEMGHVQYCQQYAHQPVVFRTGANPGFHEAVGDVLGLSVASSDHLKKINLLDDQDDDEEIEINKLMEIALEKLAFLPFGYLVDSYRWKVFSGEFPEDQLNSKWWELRLKYQGLCPPVRRTNDDFEPTAMYHMVADVPYIRYFVSYILQFQFHKALCEAANHTGPLHHCDIYQNKEAGRLLSETLSLGSRVHWSEAMKVITQGKTDKIDIQPLIEYFEPLMKWLEKQNEGETIGWKSDDPMMCPEAHK